MIEYRLCWSASSNINFRGETDWAPWDEEDDTAEDVDRTMNSGRVDCLGLEEVLNASGFEWWVETRES